MSDHIGHGGVALDSVTVKDMVNAVLRTAPTRIEQIKVFPGRVDAKWYLNDRATLKDLYFYTADEPRIIGWPGQVDHINIEFVTPCPGEEICNGVLIYRYGVDGSQGKEVLCPYHALRYDPLPEPTVSISEALRRAQEGRSALLQEAGVPLFYENYSIENWPGSDIAARTMAHGLGSGGGPMSPITLFYGNVGVGKTSLAVGLLRARVLGLGDTGLYSTVDDYLASLRPGLDMDEVMLGRIKRAKVVLLDDLGGSRLTEWGADQIDKLLVFRNAHKLHTILTTAVRSPQLHDRLDKHWDDQMSRLPTLEELTSPDIVNHLVDGNMCAIIQVGGTDLRRGRKNG
jgi:DNA replication protein DnaC